MFLKKYFVPFVIILSGLIIGGSIFLAKTTIKTPSKNEEVKKNILNIVPVSDSDHVLGNPKAKVTLVEYSDFECPFCKSFNPTMERVMDEYGKTGSVAWVYRHFPSPNHKMAMPAAISSECFAYVLGEEGFWLFVSNIFSMKTNNLTQNNIDEIASSSLKTSDQKNKYRECVTSRMFEEKINRQYDEGIKIHEVDPEFGTPYIIAFNDKGTQIQIIGSQPYTFVKQVIDTLLQD